VSVLASTDASSPPAFALSSLPHAASAVRTIATSATTMLRASHLSSTDFVRVGSISPSVRYSQLIASTRSFGESRADECAMIHEMKPKARTLLLSCVASAALVACSGDDSASTPDSGAGDATAGDALSDAAADVPIGSGSGTGSLFVFSTDLGYQLGVSFFMGDPFACMTVTDGACTVTPACAPMGTLTRAGAGAVSFSGGKLASPSTLVPGEDLNYVNVSSMPAAFMGGEMIEVTAVGDRSGVSPFDQSLVAPDFPSLTSPMIAGDGGTQLERLTIDRSQPYTVTWTPTQHADVEVYFISGNGVNVACVYPATAGTATIPSSTLMHLGAGGNGTFGVQGHSGKTFDAGGYKIRYVITAGDADQSPKHLRADVTFN
jgi:hypothetical protein